ncbi:MAG: response regulator [Phenylobacterium sp.]|nr:response regulator [Phenylobacterium sp.]
MGVRQILLVEDELLVGYLLQGMLLDLGWTVVGPAVRVDDALDMLKHEHLDAALLDVNLNGEFSYPIADALAQRGIPFMFSTGYERDRLLPSYRDHAYLQKPFHETELARVLSDLCPPDPPAAE